MPEIAIVGAGPLGLACALALQRQGLAARIYDARPAHGERHDARILALSHGSRQMLGALGAWPQAQSTPIETIHISQQGYLGRAQITARDEGVPALGYVLGAKQLTESLLARANTQGIPIEYDTRISSFAAASSEITLNTATGRQMRTQLAICCEGQIDDEAAFSRDYQQHALLCRARLTHAHQHRAYERFRQEGPLALLPYGEDYAVVWAVPATQSAALMAADELVWLAAIQRAIGQRVQLASIHERACYPLQLRMRKRVVADRQVWLGNAAQTLHPVAGQGLNLALRDVWSLAETLAGQTDPGEARSLQRYQAQRRLDRLGTIGFTDGLARLFSADLPLAGHARSLGLLALETLPPLKHFVSQRMIFGARAWL